MKILVVGASGTLGTAVTNHLKKNHEIISAGYSHGDIQVDISSIDSIKAMYQKAGKIDAVAVCTGKVAFKPFIDMSEQDLQLGLQNKLLGQVNIVKIGLEYVGKGSFTLISGILNRRPILQGSCAAMVNGALDSFVLAVSKELKNVRVNIVSPTIVQESMEKYKGFFDGFKPVPSEQVAIAFSRCIEGGMTGQVLVVE